MILKIVSSVEVPEAVRIVKRALKVGFFIVAAANDVQSIVQLVAERVPVQNVCLV